MHKLKRAAPDLSFLDAISPSGDSTLRSAPWLTVPFTETIWKTIFSGYLSTINFQIILDDGSSLIARKNAELLEGLKLIITCQTHPHLTAGRPSFGHGLRNKISRAVAVCDWFLLNQENLRVQHGFRHLTNRHLKQLVGDLAASDGAATGIYDWPTRLADFLKAEARKLTNEDVARVRIDHWDIEEVLVDPADFVLPLSIDELIRARYVCALNGWYRTATSVGGDLESFRCTFQCRPASAHIYRNTLMGQHTYKTIPDELCLGSTERTRREFLAVPVRRDDDRIGRKELSVYLGTLRALELLPVAGIPLSPSLERVDSHAAFFNSLNPPPPGRYKTLPLAVCFHALRHAVEFTLKYGDLLIDAFIKMILLSKQTGLPINEIEIQRALSPELVQFGVKRWRLEIPPMRLLAEQHHGGKPSKAAHYARFRGNEGLYELLLVLWGAAAVIVGLPTARRSGEMVDLLAGSCIDDSGRWLIFDNRKSGLGENRSTIRRPIPSLVSRTLKRLEDCQKRLLDVQWISKLQPVFSCPTATGNLRSGSNALYSAMDAFCDYVQTAQDAHGCRFYLRPHQFRRAFAMAFFWVGGIGGLETLRWFLGHVDAQHVWNYISETTPGVVLDSVRASFVLERAQASDRARDELSGLISQRFGTSAFDLLKADEMEAYIAILISDGVVSVEPEFLNAADGTSYRICVKISEGR